jgi:hypothetical protein
MKCMVMLLIIGTTGRVTKGLKTNLVAIPGKHPTDPLQKTAVLGALHTCII